RGTHSTQRHARLPSGLRHPRRAPGPRAPGPRAPGPRAPGPRAPARRRQHALRPLAPQSARSPTRTPPRPLSPPTPPPPAPPPATFPALPLLLPLDLQIQPIPQPVDLPPPCRIPNRAIRLVAMRAVVEAAASEQWDELAHRVLALPARQVPQPVVLESRRVDD